MDGMRHNGCKRAAWPSSNCRTGPRTTNLPRLGRCRVEVASQAPTSQALMASAQPSAQPAVAAAVAAARQDRLHVARSQARRPPESARHQRRPNAEQRRPCSNQGRPRACPPLSASREATPCGVMPPRQRHPLPNMLCDFRNATGTPPGLPSGPASNWSRASSTTPSHRLLAELSR